ncbi:MAG: ribosome maturation factor RimM [Tetrasphaera sp.]|nr:ribosome maturation factor RimM [Tetrasphaera sp.]
MWRSCGAFGSVAHPWENGPVSVLVARIGKPHGLDGEVTVQVHTDAPEERFVVGVSLTTQADAGSGVPRALTLRSARVHRQIWLLAFEEIPDRTGAESLRGTRLYAEHLDEPDGWYEEELRGLRVLDPAGVELGEVTGLDLGVAQDRLVIRLADGTEALVPLVDAIVPIVDVAGGRVVVDAPPGLFDLGRDG